MTTKIAPDLLRRMKADPDADVRLIVRVKGEPAPAAQHLAGGPLRVLRTFTLVPGLAVAGKARDGLRLLDEPWVDRVEEDREVRVM
jgi:hypothetical protein